MISALGLVSGLCASPAGAQEEKSADELGRSADHVTLVTVSDDGVDIANLLLEGILDKTGKVPLGGDDVCFEEMECGAAADGPGGASRAGLSPDSPALDRGATQ